MLIDHELKLGSTALDLEEAGVGALAYPLQVTAVATAANATATIAVTHCDTAGGSYTNLVSVGPRAVAKGEVVQFELPAESKRYLKATPASGFEIFLTIGKQAFKAMPEAESLKKAFVTEQA